MLRFAVIGSLNMDLTARTDQFPRPGETRKGRSFGTYPGGKGANQAVALARLGADVHMAGKLGSDVYGESYRRHLEEESVRSELVHTAEETSTGIAMIQVDDAGENSILIVPGANDAVDRPFIDQILPELLQADIFLFQLEIPVDTVHYALRRLKEHNKTTILDPAPAVPLPQDLFRYVDYLTPNESEAQTLLEALSLQASADTARPTSGDAGAGGITGDDSREETAADLKGLGVGTVILKLGGRGAYALSGEQAFHAEGYAVEPVDTTAAGDGFNAGLACGIGEGMELNDALQLANAVGARACTAVGAQSAMPSREAAESLRR